jgi:hypothetical protein
MRYFLFSLLLVGVAFGFMLTGFHGGSNNHMRMQHDQLSQCNYTSVGHRAYPDNGDLTPNPTPSPDPTSNGSK